MQELKHPNQIEFQVTGDYAMFSAPVTRMGGEKCSYQVPTYEATIKPDMRTMSHSSQSGLPLPTVIRCCNQF